MIKPPASIGMAATFASVRFSQPLSSSENVSLSAPVDISQRANGPTISTELAPLLDDLFDAFFQTKFGRRGAKGTGTRSRLWPGDEGDETELESVAWRKAGFGVFSNAMSNHNQSSDDRNHGQAKGERIVRLLDAELDILDSKVHSDKLADSFVHTDALAARLPMRCANYCARRGSAAMKRFLFIALISLLPALMRDLEEMLRAVKLRLPEVKWQDASRPTTEVCDKLHAVMRPLFDKYITGPILVSEARTVLCVAQTALSKAVNAGSEIESSLVGVVHGTINPLMAVLILGCAARPKAMQARHASASSQEFPQ